MFCIHLFRNILQKIKNRIEREIKAIKKETLDNVFNGIVKKLKVCNLLMWMVTLSKNTCTTFYYQIKLEAFLFQIKTIAQFGREMAEIYNFLFVKWFSRHKVLDTLEDSGSSILSYYSQVIRESCIMSLKKSHFLILLIIILNFNSFLFNKLLVNQLILLNPRSYIRKETWYFSTKKN